MNHLLPVLKEIRDELRTANLIAQHHNTLQMLASGKVAKEDLNRTVAQLNEISEEIDARLGLAPEEGEPK